MKDCSRFISLIRLQEHPRHFVTHVENRAAEYRMELCKLHANLERRGETDLFLLSFEGMPRWIRTSFFNFPRI